MNKQFKPFCNIRIARLSLGQWANAGRVVDDKDRTDERVLDFFFEDFALDNVRVLARCDDAEFPSELSDSFAVGGLQTRVFFE